jgi:copper transport protein
MRSLRAVLLVAVLAVAGVGVLASPAYAHALLERSYPAAGTSLPRAPHVMLLYFTEAPEPSLSTISLLDSSGQIVPGIGQPSVAPSNARELRVRLPRLADGVYTVNWRTVSKVDGHITGGSFAFGIAVQPPAGASAARAQGGSPETGSTPSPVAVAGLWLLFWGLALLAAAGATGVLVFGWRLPRGAPIVIAAGWLAAAAGILIMILSERAAAGVPFGELFGAAAGRSLLAEAAAVAVCGVAAFFAARRPAGPALVVLGAAAAGALFTHAQAGHAETQSSVRLLNVADQWLHMLAAGVWVGGLVWLLLGLRGLDGPARTAAVRRFSQLAFAAVAVIAVTGVLRAVPEVGSLGALVSTSFGVTLLIKSGLFAVLMGIAWRNRYRLVPKLAEPAPAAPAALSPVTGGAPAGPPERGPGTESQLLGAGAPPPGSAAARAISSLRRSVRSEVALAAIVLVAAAVLSGLPPASFVEAAGQKTASPAVTATGSDFGTTARVRLTVSPGTVGPNRFTVHVLGYDSGRPLPARGVRLEFSLPSNPNVASSLDLAGPRRHLERAGHQPFHRRPVGRRRRGPAGGDRGGRPAAASHPAAARAHHRLQAAGPAGPVHDPAGQRPQPPDVPAAADTGTGPGSLHVLPGVGPGGAHHLRQRHGHHARRRRPAAEAGPPRQRALRGEPEPQTRAVDLPHQRHDGRRAAAVWLLLPDHPVVTMCRHVPTHAPRGPGENPTHLPGSVRSLSFPARNN